MFGLRSGYRESRRYWVADSLAREWPAVLEAHSLLVNRDKRWARKCEFFSDLPAGEVRAGNYWVGIVSEHITEAESAPQIGRWPGFYVNLHFRSLHRSLADRISDILQDRGAELAATFSRQKLQAVYPPKEFQNE